MPLGKESNKTYVNKQKKARENTAVSRLYTQYKTKKKMYKYRWNKSCA